jgi:hypothetical protein
VNAPSDPLTCSVSYQDSIPATIPEIVWTDSKNMFLADPKRIQLEIDQTLEQVSKQLKQGIIKKRQEMKPGIIKIEPKEQLKDVIQRVTVPLITMLCGHDLFDYCMCGATELYRCPDCLKSLKIKK